MSTVEKGDPWRGGDRERYGFIINIMTQWAVAGRKQAAFVKNPLPDLLLFFLPSSQHRPRWFSDTMLTNFRVATAVEREKRRICMCAHAPKALRVPQNGTELLPELKRVLGSIKVPGCSRVFNRALHLQGGDGPWSSQLTGKVSACSPCNIHFIDSL